MGKRALNNILAFLTVIVILFLLAASATAQIPQRAYQYQKTLRAETLRAWGLCMPEGALEAGAGTIHQESGWRPLAQSPYAKGLTQFTDATWKDMQKLDPSIPKLGDVWNPTAAIRAMVAYHKVIWKSLDVPEKDLNRWAFVFSAYNGGPGWVKRDRTLCSTKPGCDSRFWFGHVELYSARATWAFNENRGYPRNIIKRWMPLYKGF